MAIISVNMTTNEDDGTEPLKVGHYDIKITAGLDENLDEVMTEASERVRVLLDRLPPAKRYPRFNEF